MASLSDHIRRDAEHAGRSEVRVLIMQYVRRMDELVKAHVKEELENATLRGDTIDGRELGKTAANLAIGAYIGNATPQPAVNTSDTPALDAYTASTAPHPQL